MLGPTAGRPGIPAETFVDAPPQPVGSTLPGISALQAEYEVRGLNVIRQAQGVLQDEGLLEPRQGSGTFVLALPGRDTADRVDRADTAELRQVVTELQQALASAQATLNRVARRLERRYPGVCLRGLINASPRNSLT